MKMKKIILLGVMMIITNLTGCGNEKMIGMNLRQ